MRHGCRLGLLLLSIIATGCSTTFDYIAPPDDLPPAMLDKPMSKVAPAEQAIADVVVHQVSRGTRGGFVRIAFTNRLLDGVNLDWTKLKIQLSSGETRNVIDAVQLEKLCAEFKLQAYGIASAEFTLPAGWALPSTDTPVVKIKPGETANLVITFGAMPEIDWLSIDFTPALAKEIYQPKRVKQQPLYLMVAVPLPEIVAPPKPPGWWPDWLHVGLVFSSG